MLRGDKRYSQISIIFITPKCTFWNDEAIKYRVPFFPSYLNDSDYTVRRIVVDNITDQNILAGIAQSDKSLDVRKTAVDYLYSKLEIEIVSFLAVD